MCADVVASYRTGRQMGEVDRMTKAAKITPWPCHHALARGAAHLFGDVGRRWYGGNVMETIVGNAIQRLQDCQRKTIVSLLARELHYDWTRRVHEVA